LKLGVFGAGYVGLVSAAGFAEFGHTVCCGDNNPQVVAQLQSGIVPISEPNLQELVTRQNYSGRLFYTVDLNELVNFADVLILAVGTPPTKDGTADLSAIYDVSLLIGNQMKSDKTVIIKSTVPPGTARVIETLILTQVAKRSLTLRVSVVSNPEFLREGSAVDDFLHPDRIIVGISSESDEPILNSIYAPLIREQYKLLVMSRESAELTKYAANAMLATRISFINEISRLAERVGADVKSIQLGMGADTRIGKDYLSPGIGFGGSCFPKDLKALSSIGSGHSLQMHLVNATIKVNEIQRSVLVEKALIHFESLSGLSCAVWGLAFKPETDDIRDSPALEIISSLLAHGVQVSAYDPIVKKIPSHIVSSDSNFKISETSYGAVVDADMLFVLTEWREFMSPDFWRMHQMMRQPVVFDGRNIWNPQSLKSRGFTYYGIGR
jgi:UDPglucose 6-dehydrogenase